MVDPAHAVLAGELVKIVNQLDPILFLTVQGYGLAMIEGDFDLLGLVGCMPRVDCPLKRLGRGLDPGIFQNPGLDRAAQRFWSVLKIDFLVASTSMPCAAANSSSCDRVHFHSRTGATILRSGARVWNVTSNRTWSFPLPVQPAPRRGAVRARADHELSDQRATQRRGQRVLALVERPGHERGPDEVIDEQVALSSATASMAPVRSASGESPRCPGLGPGRTCRRSHPCRTFR